MRLTGILLLFFFLAPFARGEVILEGEFVQGALVLGKTQPGSKVFFDGEEIRVSDEGYFLLGFNRDEPAKVSLIVEHTDGVRENRMLTVRPRDYEIDYVEGVPAKTVNPPAAALQRIREETRLIVEARSGDLPRTDFLREFTWPASGRISGVYGSQRVYNGAPRRPHYGLDIAADIGAPVVAPASGVITLAHPDMFFSGGTIIIDHGHGLTSSFLHLSKVLVKEGAEVTRGEKIGEIGMSGRANGPHLDWRLNLFKRRLDPRLLLDPQEKLEIVP